MRNPVRIAEPSRNAGLSGPAAGFRSFAGTSDSPLGSVHQSTSAPSRSGPDRHLVIVMASGVLVLAGFIARRSGADVAAAADLLLGTVERLLRGMVDVDPLTLLAAAGAGDRSRGRTGRIPAS